VKKVFSLVFIVFLINLTLTAQILLTAELLGSKTQQQLVTEFGNPLFKNGVKYYKVTYLTPDVQGNSSVASGFMAIPDDLTKTYPLLCYQHGTSSEKKDIPSALNFESNLTIAFSGMGFMAVTPDYLGLGDSPGIHPYVHAETEASVGVDILRAAREYAEKNQVYLNEQVFVTGYSQGGHAAMALHRKLETELPEEFPVTASSPMSGPYSIGEVMRDFMLSGQEYNRPAYLINTLISYQYVYGNLFASFQEAFKPEYVEPVQQYYDENISLSVLNDKLIALLDSIEGASIPIKMIKDSLVQEITNNPSHPVNVAMTANNVYDWTPKAPTRLFYCQADDQVNFENSLVAEAAMMANGAASVDAVDINPSLDHVGCVVPAVLNTIFFFLQYQQIGTAPVSAVWENYSAVSISPNPAGSVFFVKNLPSKGTLRLFSAQGQLLRLLNVPAGDVEVSTDGLQDGLYWLEVSGASRNSWSKLFVKK
jgi:hypothetical protein